MNKRTGLVYVLKHAFCLKLKRYLQRRVDNKLTQLLYVTHDDMCKPTVVCGVDL